MKYSSEKTVRTGRLMKVSIVIFAAMIVVAIFALGYGWNWYQQQLKPFSTSPSTVAIVIPGGASTKQIAQLLEQKKVIRSALAFEWYVRQNNLRESLQAGNYSLDSSRSVQSIVNDLSKGKVQTKTFTILPGKRLDQIRASFIASGYDTALVDAALDVKNYANHQALVNKPKEATLEGYLFPETFRIPTTATPKDIVTMSLNEMSKELSADLIDAYKARGLTPHQAITLASIVIKESSNATEQRKIAGVFYNRLAKGIPLGADPTYQYASAIAGVPNDGKIDSPYNTRLYAGLPPGPIGNITSTSLKAVAQPEVTENLFFVAGDDGKIYYSKTQAEHEALTKKYCIELCSRY